MINEFLTLSTTTPDALDSDGFWDISIKIDTEHPSNGKHIVLSISGSDGEAEKLIPKTRDFFRLDLEGIDDLSRILNYMKESLLIKISRDKEIFGD